MHTFEAHGVAFLHNGDFSGDVEIVKKDEPARKPVVVPMAALVAFVSEWARCVRMAKFESATDREVLGLPPT